MYSENFGPNSMQKRTVLNIPKLVIVFHIYFFHRALQIFEYINIYHSILMTQIGTKFQCVFKLLKSDYIPKLHTEISHRIQHTYFHRAFQNFEYINVYCFFLKCTAITTK